MTAIRSGPWQCNDVGAPEGVRKPRVSREYVVMAGGQVPLCDNPDMAMNVVRERIMRVFARGKEPRPLLDAAEDSGPDTAGPGRFRRK